MEVAVRAAENQRHVKSAKGVSETGRIRAGACFGPLLRGRAVFAARKTATTKSLRLGLPTQPRSPPKRDFHTKHCQKARGLAPAAWTENPPGQKIELHCPNPRGTAKLDAGRRATMNHFGAKFRSFLRGIGKRSYAHQKRRRAACQNWATEGFWLKRIFKAAGRQTHWNVDYD